MSETIDHNNDPNIDPDNVIETVYNGCKVRLFFSLEENNVKRGVLDQILLAFDRRIQDSVNVQV